MLHTTIYEFASSKAKEEINTHTALACERPQGLRQGMNYLQVLSLWFRGWSKVDELLIDNIEKYLRRDITTLPVR
jgi:hypothetical protein